MSYKCNCSTMGRICSPDTAAVAHRSTLHSICTLTPNDPGGVFFRVKLCMYQKEFSSPSVMKSQNDGQYNRDKSSDTCCGTNLGHLTCSFSHLRMN